MNTLGEATDIHSINIKNASDILGYGNKDQIAHLFKLYNEIASKAGTHMLTPADLQIVLKSRGLSGFGDIDWGSIGSVAGKIGSGLAQAAQAVGPLILQKYQIDKLPSATPATPAAISSAATTGVPSGKGGGMDWTTIALYGGGALVLGSLMYFIFFKRKRK